MNRKRDSILAVLLVAAIASAAWAPFVVTSMGEGPPGASPVLQATLGTMPVSGSVASPLRWVSALAWTSVPGASGYNVYRSAAGASEVLHATTGPVLTHRDTTDLQGGKVYTYRVAGFNAEGEGPKSNAAGGQVDVAAFKIAASTVSQTGSNELSIGSNWKSGRALINDRFNPTLVTFNDGLFPPGITFTRIPQSIGRGPSIVGADPILFTDSVTGRTFNGEEVGSCAQLYFTDNDGQTWAPSVDACAGADHLTVASGPLPVNSPLRPAATWPNASQPRAVYYCAQNIADALCSVSLDGGRTFTVASQTHMLAGSTSVAPVCTGLHGKARVSSFDGAVYIPIKSCSANQAVVVSTDGGITWRGRPVLGNPASRFDPAVAVGSGGRVYLAMMTLGSTPKVAVSDNQGATWSVKNLPAPAGFSFVRAEMPAAVAGDNDRAAVAFLATNKVPSPACTNTDPAEWRLFVSMTYDGGSTWTTTDMTGTDPVQIGKLGDPDDACRNLLDFFDVTVDRYGRVLVGFQDGCTTRRGVAGTGALNPCLGPGGVRNQNTVALNSRDSWATLAVQIAGKGLFAGLDPDDLAPVIESAPDLTVEAAGPDGSIVNFVAPATWDNRDGPGISVCAPASGSMFPIGSTTVVCNAQDSSANKAVPVDFRVHVVDTTAPSLQVPDPIEVVAASSQGNQVEFSSTSEDLVDGAVEPDCSPSSGSLFGLGTTVVSCQATDAAGNVALQEFPVSVRYEWSGFLAPLDDKNEFRAGSTIPVKFQLAGDSSAITDAVASLFVSPAGGEETRAGSRDDANATFAYDAATATYQLNWATKGLDPGDYVIRVDLGDGVQRSAAVHLKDRSGDDAPRALSAVPSSA